MNPTQMSARQLSLFEYSVLEGIAKTQSTAGAVRHFQVKHHIPQEEFLKKIPAGKGGMVPSWPRKIRYIQQTLKGAGLVKNGQGRGEWELSDEGRKVLQAKAKSGDPIKVAFITKSGVAFFGDGSNLADIFPGEVELIFTSPPYLLTNPRSYGDWGTSEAAYVDKVVSMVESWLPMLSPTGSIVLNLGESTLSGTGQQSLSNERILIRLEDSLGLHLVQKFVWENPAKPPTGYWVTRAKQRAVCSTENLFWLSLNPKSTKADSSRVKVPYSASQAKLITLEHDDLRHTRPSGQSAKASSFYKDNGGALPKNILKFSHEGANSSYSRSCRAAGIQRHPAMFPQKLVEFFVQFLTETNDLVVDPCSGSGVLGAAAASLGRLWATAELILEYIYGASLRHDDAEVC